MKKIKIVTWNIWGGENIDNIIECLRTVDADIIGLQEVLEELDGSNNNAENIASALGYEWAYTPTCTLDYEHSHLLKIHGYTREMHWGNAVLSKYPIVGNNTYVLSNHKSRTALVTNIAVDSENLTAISTHLAYSKDSELIRSEQVDTLLKVIPDERAIIMGDFNELPKSVVIEKMRERLIDTQENTASDSAQISEAERIDYIFTTKDIKYSNSRIINSDASDHLPILTEIML